MLAQCAGEHWSMLSVGEYCLSIYACHVSYVLVMMYACTTNLLLLPDVKMRLIASCLSKLSLLPTPQDVRRLCTQHKFYSIPGGC